MNRDLCRVLWKKHPRWRNCIEAERIGLVAGESRLQLDILVRHPSGLPVAIETEFGSGPTVEKDAIARLGKVLSDDSKRIEQVIALCLPESLRFENQGELDEKLELAQFELCVYSISGPQHLNQEYRRWPSEGWVQGGIDDLSMTIEHTALSENQITDSMEILDAGIDQAANILLFHSKQTSNETPELIAACLHQSNTEQTIKMAMAILANAMVFHESIANIKNVPNLNRLKIKNGQPSASDILKVWNQVMDEINYFPIFSIATEILQLLTKDIAPSVLDCLEGIVGKLILLGATSQHDFSGRMFQKLIEDRKFLATFYTLPTSATLLSELAVSRLSTDWSKKSTIEQLQVGDFACGTGALLNAAYSSILSRYRRKGGDDAEIHRKMMEKVLIGADIMPAATHLTTSVLSSVHPSIEFFDTNIITMRYGEAIDDNGNKDVFIGSLELFDDQQGFRWILDTTQEYISGTGRGKKKNVELPHGSFDLVIMNPPFTRSTNHEGSHKNVNNPAFAGFKTKTEQQKKMSEKLKRIRPSGKASDDNAGLATNFIDLANVKLKKGGILAFVIPATFASGDGWANARNIIGKNYEDVVIVSIATAEHLASAFSADTSIGEVLVVGKKKPECNSVSSPITYVNLPHRPVSILEAMWFAKAIERQRKDTSEEGKILQIGTDKNHIVGHLIASPNGFNGQEGNLGVIRVKDITISTIALKLSNGTMSLPRIGDLDLPLVKLGELGKRGLLDRDINEATKNKNGIYRGPFKVIKLQSGDVPKYPILWSHEASSIQPGRESRLIVSPDRQGIVRPQHEEKAQHRWKSSSRLCFNRDFGFGSQRLAACITPQPVIGGMAWPNFICNNHQYEIPLVLWMNTTLGLFSFWCTGTRQQNGRSRITITRLPSLSVFDVRCLTKKQFKKADKIFERFADQDLLPANEAYRDEIRHELDKAVLIDLLGLSEEILKHLELLRDIWCAEPTVRGRKKMIPKNVQKLSS